MKRIIILLIVFTFILQLSSVANAGTFPNSSELFGVFMPNIAYAINRDADNEEVTENGITQTYLNFTDVDYVALDKYLCDDYSADISSVEGDVVTLSINQGNVSVLFVYDRNNKVATMTYPKGTRIETSAALDNAKKHVVLPPLKDLFGEDTIPSLSKAINRSVDEIKKDKGLTQEIFNDFSIEDYETYSAYLSEYGCYIEDSSVTDNVMTVKLKKGDTGFTFIYDYAANSAIVEYAEETSTEPIITPTPKPTNSPVPSPTSKPAVKTDYSESHCYNAAVTYLKQYLKNPSSLTIHGYTSSKSGDEFTFVIDYSAQNGFGGYNREKFLVSVNSITDQVTLAYTY